MDQFRVEVVLRHHWCRQFLGGEFHLCYLVPELMRSTFTVEYQTLRSLVRFTVGKARWQSFERYSLTYTKGKSKGRQFSDPRRSYAHRLSG